MMNVSRRQVPPTGERSKISVSGQGAVWFLNRLAQGSRDERTRLVDGGATPREGAPHSARTGSTYARADTTRRAPLVSRRVATPEESHLRRAKLSIGLLHPVCTDEHLSTLDAEKYPERGHELHFASYRGEFGGKILPKRFRGVHWGAHSSRAGLPLFGSFPYVVIARREEFTARRSEA